MAKIPQFKDWIVAETADYIIINKPSGVACLKERGNTLAVDILSHAKRYYAEVWLCHRLDKFTSGALLLAKNEEAMRNAGMQFQKKQVHKVYHALVHGIAEFNAFEVELPILIDENRRTVRINKQFGKKSKTVFTTLKKYNAHSLVACKLYTGRMHQIRIHLGASGFPIINDVLYGGTALKLSDVKHKYNYNRTGEEQPLIKRFALHAFELGFKDLSGKDLHFEIPYPKDFRALEQQLEKYTK